MSRIRPGALPGTLTPAETAETPRISVLTFTRARVDEAAVAGVDEAVARLAPGAITWINVDGLGDPDVFARLGEHFGLHPLALEDVLALAERPKLERYEKHLFLVLRSIRLAGGARAESPAAPTEVREEQISLFVGPEWVITVQERGDGDPFDPVRAAIRHGRGRVRDAGADYLAYLLVDAVVDAYFPVIEALNERIATLEEEAIASGSEETLLRIHRMRHELLALRRAIWPVREVIAALQREDSPLVTADTRVFLRDVYDHAVQALEVVESLRETSVGVMEVYLSAQNQRLNGIMKVLTVIATIFIPLTFIASIYGMNFRVMPELEWRYGYPFALGLMAVTAIAMIAYFRRRGWW